MANRLIKLCGPDIGKSSWPELVGYNGDDAAEVIEKENPNVTAIVIHYRTPVHPIFHCDRVRVVVDDHGIVVVTPVIT